MFADPMCSNGNDYKNVSISRNIREFILYYEFEQQCIKCKQTCTQPEENRDDGATLKDEIVQMSRSFSLKYAQLTDFLYGIFLNSKFY